MVIHEVEGEGGRVWSVVEGGWVWSLEGEVVIHEVEGEVVCGEGGGRCGLWSSMKYRGGGLVEGEGGCGL